MANIRSVARQAGVSIATVSRIINDSSNVKPETRKLVKQSMRAVGYTPPRHGPKKRTFGLIIPNLSNPYYADLADVVEERVRDNGHRLLFCCARNDTVRELKAVAECVKAKAAGIFLVPQNTGSEHIKRLKELEVPITLMTRLSSTFPSVAVNHQLGGRIAASHLLSLGHQRIAYIGRIGDEEDKYVGFHSCLREHGCDLKQEFMFDPDLVTGKAKEWNKNKDKTNDKAVDEFIESLVVPGSQAANRNKTRVSAIFCNTDVFAYRSISALSKLGFSVPGDIIVVGFDNSILADRLGITSVSQPLREIANASFDCLNDLIAARKRKKSFEPILLTPRLVLRKSSMYKIEAGKPGRKRGRPVKMTASMARHSRR